MCPYCPQDKLVGAYKGERVMSLNTFKKCIDKVENEVKIGFTGMCEPFLNPNCMRMVKYAAGEHPVYIGTTLVGFKERYIKKLEKIELTEFAVHLPGDNDIFKVDIDILKKVAESKITNKSFHYHGEPRDEFKFLDTWSAGIHSRAGNIDNLKTDKIEGAVYCERNMAHPVLLPNGNLVLCCMDFGLEHIIGNLITQSIDEIYDGREFCKVVKANQQESNSICHGCVFARKIEEK